jgi:hypothetical protein
MAGACLLLYHVTQTTSIPIKVLRKSFCHQYNCTLLSMRISLSAGAMSPPTTLDLEPLPKTDRRPRRTVEGEEAGKKPKKVNSEIRKQQNRIASRNYRTLCPRLFNYVPWSTNLFVAGEKRKRKLQYLQQLVKDESNDELTPYTSPEEHEAHIRAHSVDYDVAQRSSPFALPSDRDFTTLGTSGTATLCPIPTTTTSVYDSRLLPIAQSYSPFEPPWNSPIYANMDTWH